MKDLEQHLRAAMSEQADLTPSPRSGLALAALRRNRRAQQVRVGAMAGSVAAVVGTAGVVVGTVRQGRHVAAGAPEPSVTPASSALATPAVTPSVAPAASPSSVGVVTTAPAPDPRVLADAEDGAFPMPDASGLRSILVSKRVHSIVNVGCGGPALPDSTADRIDQARYAVLPLIAKKGISEYFDASTVNAGVVDATGCDDKVLPSFRRWYDLMSVWDPAVQAAAKSPAVVATHTQVAACLSAKLDVRANINKSTVFMHTAGHITVSDPTASFFGAADADLSVFREKAAWHEEMMRISGIFVSCTGPYFQAMSTTLQPEKDRLVRANRPLLERMAAELTAAGYVP